MFSELYLLFYLGERIEVPIKELIHLLTIISTLVSLDFLHFDFSFVLYKYFVEVISQIRPLNIVVEFGRKVRCFLPCAFC